MKSFGNMKCGILITTLLGLTVLLLMSSIPVEAKKKKYEGDFEFVDEVSFGNFYYRKKSPPALPAPSLRVLVSLKTLLFFLLRFV